MDKDRLDQCIKALNEKGVKAPCPRCGKRAFSVVGESFFPLNDDPSVVKIGGPAIPTLMVACDNCGYMSHHALGPLGLMKKGGKHA